MAIQVAHIRAALRKGVTTALRYLYKGRLKSPYADYDAMVVFDQMLIFQHYSLPRGAYTSFIGVAALGFPWYRSSHPDPRKILNCSMTSSSVRYCLPAIRVFFHVGEQEIVRWCQIRRIWRVINQFEATVTHRSNYNHRSICVQEHCNQWWNRTTFISFPGRFCNVSSNTFQSPELLIQCGFTWKKTMQLVSGKVEFNGRQVSLLWHNSFLVSLWTFQLTLIFF